MGCHFGKMDACSARHGEHDRVEYKTGEKLHTDTVWIPASKDDGKEFWLLVVDNRRSYINTVKLEDDNSKNFVEGCTTVMARYAKMGHNTLSIIFADAGSVPGGAKEGLNALGARKSQNRIRK
jgi:hypothetical protein